MIIGQSVCRKIIQVITGQSYPILPNALHFQRHKFLAIVKWFLLAIKSTFMAAICLPYQPEMYAQIIDFKRYKNVTQNIIYLYEI